MPDENVEIIEGDPAYYLPDRLAGDTPLTAGGVPVNPPREWFNDPGLTKPTPLQVLASGQVYGHIATWDSKHIGMPGVVRPPRSKSNYAFFATGSVLCADGSQYDGVGQITLVGGHAPLDVDVPKAVKHYDDTQSAMCDVAIGEDRHGIWVAGGLRPDVEDRSVRQLRASAVSGDWRPINGNLELVAVCSVNVPGFPIPRARVASGQVLALTAAGVEPLVAERIRELGEDMGAGDDVRTMLSEFGQRMERIEDWMLTIADPNGSTVLDAEPEVPQFSEDDLAALRQRVRPDAAQEAPAAEVLSEPEPEPEVVEASQPTAEDLRSRVHGTTPAVEATPEPEAVVAVDEPEAVMASLRQRVRPQPSAEDLRARVHGGDAVPLASAD